MSEPVRVLHVDDTPDFAEMSAAFLERTNDRFAVDTATDATAGLDYLAEHEVDCVIADHDMADLNGIEFLEAVRRDHPELPFILFTGKGSEEVASEAISAGVTDYLQKTGGRDQYTVLANRVRNAVEKARAQRERRRQLEAIETVDEGVSILDPDGYFVYVNPVYAEMHGHEPEEMVGEHWELVYADEQIPAVRDSIFPEVEQTGNWHGTTTGVRSDGDMFTKSHTLAKTARGEFVCTGRDLTAEQARERERDRYETIVETLGDPIYALDDEGRYTFVNDAFVEETGYQRSEILGEPASILVSDEDFERGRKLVRELLEDDERRATTWEFTQITADGDHVPTEGHMALLPRGENGEFRGTAGVLRDISERKRHERELKRERDRLDEFSSVVSHDLQSPLSVADGRLELARKECDSDHLDDVSLAHERMRALIDDLLRLAREGDRIDEPGSVDLGTFAEHCWQNVETDEDRFLSRTDVTIEADRGRLAQLLENLYRNAIEHGGADVTVSVGDLEGGFYVEDDGDGIQPGYREDVFEAGYSTSAGGTGFGLSIVKQIANAHGWTVNLTDAPDGGARFEFTGVNVLNGS